MLLENVTPPVRARCLDSAQGSSSRAARDLETQKYYSLEPVVRAAVLARHTPAEQPLERWWWCALARRRALVGLQRRRRAAAAARRGASTASLTTALLYLAFYSLAFAFAATRAAHDERPGLRCTRRWYVSWAARAASGFDSVTFCQRTQRYAMLIGCAANILFLRGVFSRALCSPLGARAS